jgi:hypothetical protein
VATVCNLLATDALKRQATTNPEEHYTMSKPTRATKFIHQAAERVRASGIVIDWNSAFETVSIDANGEEGIFMQGCDAAQFIQEIKALCKRYPSLDEYTAALAMAEPYLECIFN